jgi:hypothetical protein
VGRRCGLGLLFGELVAAQDLASDVAVDPLGALPERVELAGERLVAGDQRIE